VEVAVDLERVVAEAGVRALGEGQLDPARLPLDVGVLPRSRLRPRALTSQAVVRGEPADRLLHLPGDPGVGLHRVLRMEGESFPEDEPALGAATAELLDLWPRLLRVDVVGGERRHAAEVIDPGVE